MRRRRGRPIDGVLLVDKPAGPTSFAVVKSVQAALSAQKAGHTGTLDPAATGLLIICLGAATRLVAYLTAADKRYLAQVRLGVSTDTLDAEGAVVATADPAVVEAVDAERFGAALAAFRGEIEQRPPAYSAIRVEGERLHVRARRGEIVEAPTRVVRIHHLELLSATPPDFLLDVRCSKGTYIRSLASDLGDALGTGAHLAGLRRTEIGAFSVARARTLDAIVAEPEETIRGLIGPSAALAHLPAVVLDGPTAERVALGQRPSLHGLCLAGPDERSEILVRALDHEERLVALLGVGPGGAVRIERGFPRTPDDGDA